jgi:hypothetical protein
VRWVLHGVLFVALAAGVFGLLPRLGGLTRDAASLRHARPAFMVAAVVEQAVSLGCYAQLYRRILAALGAKVRFRLAADVVLASFFVSHLTPFGSATGTLVNVSTLEAVGIEASMTGEGIALTSLMSTLALIVLFGTGFVTTAGRHLSHTYLTIAGVALFLVVAMLAIVFAVGAHPVIAGRAGRWAARVARRFRPGIDPEQAAQTGSRLASLARSALSRAGFPGQLRLRLGRPALRPALARSDVPRGALPARFWAAGRRLRGGEHRQRHPGNARQAGSGRGHAGGHHRGLRRAAGDRGPGRTRLPARELLASAAARCRGLSPGQAPVSQGRLARALNTAGEPITAGRIHFKFTFSERAMILRPRSTSPPAVAAFKFGSSIHQ